MLRESATELVKDCVSEQAKNLGGSTEIICARLCERSCLATNMSNCTIRLTLRTV